jgi:hypothetical protein
MPLPVRKDDPAGEARDRVQSDLRRLLAEPARQSPVTSACSSSDETRALSGHGILCDAQRRELQHAALRDIIQPCAERLLARHRARSSDVELAASGAPQVLG